MSIRSSLKLASLLSVTGIAVLLSACSKHENPVKMATVKEATGFLVDASTYAELADKSIKIDGRGGYYYGDCMQGKHKTSTCNNLYKAMVKYGKKQRDFEDITIADLKDKVVFKDLVDDYERAILERQWSGLKG